NLFVNKDRTIPFGGLLHLCIFIVLFFNTVKSAGDRLRISIIRFVLASNKRTFQTIHRMTERLKSRVPLWNKYAALRQPYACGAPRKNKGYFLQVLLHLDPNAQEKSVESVNQPAIHLKKH